MAEFCKKCAYDLGMKDYDSPPLFCEHCKKNKLSTWQKILKWFS